MSRKPAKTTQADLARAIRAAKQTGAGDVVLRQDGSIVISLFPSGEREGTREAVDAREIEIVL